MDRSDKGHLDGLNTSASQDRAFTTQEGFVQDADKQRGVPTYNKSFLVYLATISTIGGFLFGYDCAVIGGAQLYFVDDWPDITDLEIATIVTITMAGAAVGALFSGSISDRYGRKRIIVLSDVFFTLGALIAGLAPTIWCLILGRFVLGLGVGVASQIVPLYLSEVAPKEVRGQLVAFNVLVLAIGELIAAILCFVLRPHWRILIGIAGVVSLVQMVGMIFMPESPRWLGKEGRFEQMTAIMHKVYKPEFIEEAKETLREEVDNLKEACMMSECERLRTLCSCYGRCIFIGVALLSLQQLDGITTALYYGPIMMQNAGIQISGLSKDESALVLNIPMGITNLIGAIISILYIEKKGRRGVLLWTTPVLALCWIMAAIGMQFTGEDRSQTSQTLGGYTAIIALLTFMFFFAVGMGPIPWTVNSEIYPLHIIGTANSIAASANWITNFFVNQVFKVIFSISLAAQVGMYLMLGFFCLLTFAFTWYFMTETAGKTIEQNLNEILGHGYQERDPHLQKERK